MAFGVSVAGAISRSQNNSVQVAEKISETGIITDMTSHGGATELTLEEYVDVSSFTNEAVNHQSGTSIVTAHGTTESNTDYAKVSKTTRTALPATTTAP